MLLLAATLAFAQDPASASSPADPAVEEEPLPPVDTLVSIRAVAETWSDPAIGTLYATGGLLGAVGVVVPLSKRLRLDVEAGYRRMYQDDGAEEPDDTYRFEVVPISIVPEFTFVGRERPLDGFVGLGPSFAGFREHAPANVDGLGVTRGAKFSLEARAGLRIDTGLIQERMAPTSPVRGVDVELYGARRLQLPGDNGFDLDAWRGGLGVGVRL
jgi:hypothetical protein